MNLHVRNLDPHTLTPGAHVAGGLTRGNVTTIHWAIRYPAEFNSPEAAAVAAEDREYRIAVQNAELAERAAAIAADRAANPDKYAVRTPSGPAPTMMYPYDYTRGT